VFLTAAELQALTGRTRSDGQRHWLERNGWIFTTNACGRPVVLSAYATKRLGGAPVSVQPNFDALRKAS
jgi:hypothetical protein